MYNQSDKVPVGEEFSMPSTVAGLASEIHSVITQIEDRASMVEMSCRTLRGNQPQSVDAANKTEGKPEESVIGSMQGAVVRLQKLRSYLSEYGSELQTRLG